MTLKTSFFSFVIEKALYSATMPEFVYFLVKYLYFTFWHKYSSEGLGNKAELVV